MEIPRSAVLVAVRQLLPTRRSRPQLLVLILGTLLLVLALVGVIAHYVTPGPTWALAIVGLAPYLMLAAPTATLILLVSRHWLTFVVAVVVTTIGLTTQAHLYRAADAPPHSRQVVVMTSNLLLGEADAEAVVAAVRRHSVDVLMLEELTAAEQARLIQAGLDTLLPDHISAPTATSAGAGTGLWSRYPLSSAVSRSDFSYHFVTAMAAIPGRAHGVRLIALHMAGPYPDDTAWQRDMRHLPAVLALLGTTGSVVVGGDFNATPDFVQFRRLLHGGYQDAAAQAGAGYTRTWPANRSYPPVLALDHVLTREASANRVFTVEIPGSDHRALIARVQIPQA